jgi:hypothetical protein
MLRRLSILICAAVLLWIPHRALAFAVAPGIMEISGKRGDTIERTIAVINNSTAEQTYYLGALKFVPGEGSGSPEFIPFEVDHSGLPEWLVFPVKEVAIPPRTKVDVPFQVVIPQGAASGSYFAAVTVSTAPHEIVETNGASIEAKTAVLLFLTVEGETVEKLALLDFTSEADGRIVSDLSVPYQYRLQNQGNVFVKPEASVRLTDIFGRTVLVADGNPDQGRVLPESTRTFEGETASRPDGFVETVRSQLGTLTIGPVTATLTVRYADEELAETFSFWVIPWQLIICAVVLTILLKLIWNGLQRGRDRLGEIETGG